ncbi:TPA: hypothetical protein PXJ90_001948, partial [Yersinia enterocolitica]|nr:hypothetical protein [Yersinia enterocolitica]
HKDNMPWLYRLLSKKAYNVAVVAQANKTARILWSMLVHHTEYRTLSVFEIISNTDKAQEQKWIRFR